MEPVKDWKGNVIEVGDIIYYAVKESTSVVLNEARVTEIKTGFDWNGNPSPYIKVHWLRSTGGEWASKWRTVFDVWLSAMDTVTLVSKANAVTVTYVPESHPEWRACK